MNEDTKSKQAMVYIRAENLEKWQEIKNKSQWINDELSGLEPEFERRVQQVVMGMLQEIGEGLRGY